ncbi:MAG: antibiotic biosynthesis monooxygenase, partial [Methanomicrobiales archaeon]|nr:antibiotic biosynthesis monooxygenase [Methanomicrobiales archaeon]
MKNAGVLFSVGNWVVRPGQEKAFIEAWTEFAEWTMEHQKGAVYGQLLQDIVQQGHFVSFGPWETVQDIEAWRSTPE